jgi:hypothetical protein
MPSPPLFGSTLRDYLKGSWRIDREISDRRSASIARFAGKCDFSRLSDGLSYAEAGLLTVDGREHEATQTNRWEVTGEETAIVYFADDKPFHNVHVRMNAAVVEHWCAPDEYRGNYIFESASIWHLTWRVTGPRKDYTACSRFTRLHHPTQSLVSANQR